MPEPTLLVVTEEQLKEGFLIRWSSGRIQRCEFVVVSKRPDGNYVVREPRLAGDFAFNAGDANA